MAVQRHYPPEEYQTYIGDHLPIARLVEIWRGLHERERLSFVHSLESTLADKVIELCTAPATASAEGKRNGY